MVGREELPNAVALNASLFNASRVVGPAVAGVLIAGFGVGVCFLINTITFLAVLAGLLLMRKEELVPLQRTGEPPTMMRGIREGFSWVLASRADAPRTPDRHGGQHRRLQLPRPPAAARLGHASDRAGGVRHPLRLLRRRRARRGTAVSCDRPCELEGARSRHRRLQPLAARSRPGGRQSGRARVLLFIAGACFTLWTSNANSILQLNAPDHLRGRVVSLYLWAFAGLAPIGGLFAGWLVDLGGTQLSFTVAGLTGLAMTLFTARQLVGIRRAAAVRRRRATSTGSRRARMHARQRGRAQFLRQSRADSRGSRSPTRPEVVRRAHARPSPRRRGLRLRRSTTSALATTLSTGACRFATTLGVFGLDSPQGRRVRCVVGSGHATRTKAPSRTRPGSSPARRRFPGVGDPHFAYTAKRSVPNS